MERQRNYGIDLLRAGSMYLVVLLHIIGIGGVITGSELLSANFHAAWLIRVGALCAVNCYALISGFVGVHARHRIASLAQLWMQALVYSAGIGLACRFAFSEAVNARTLLGCFFPVSSAQYWYLSAYVGMFFLVPLANFATEHMPRRSLGIALAGTLCLFSLLPISPLTDAFLLHDGYSPLWLFVMYLLGIYLRKYDLLARLKPWKWALIYVFCVLFAWAPRMAALWLRPSLWGDCYGNLAIEYTSPTMVLAAVALLGVFSQLRLPQGLQRPVRALSACSFGVYLLHAHPLVFRLWLTDRFAGLGSVSTPELILSALGAALAVWGVCLLVDGVRLWLFRLCCVPKAARWLEGKVRALLDRF